MNLILMTGLMISASLFPLTFPEPSTLPVEWQGQNDSGQAHDQITKSVAIARGAKVSVRGLTDP
jgi:hypothetical protein